MDLGFGSSNQIVGDVTSKVILRDAKAREAAIQDEMEKYDALLNSSEDTLEALRERRLAQLKQHQTQRQKWRDAGHGTYQELGAGGNDARDVAKEFFDAAKGSAKLVVHFYRPTTRYCDVFHSHLEKLAHKHLETRFVKINVENCDSPIGSGASFLVEKLGIIIMPTVVIVKERKAAHHIRGFDELGGTDFSTQTLAYVIGAHGGLVPKDDEQEAPDEQENRRMNSIRIGRGEKPNSIRRGQYKEDYDDDEE